MGRRCTHLHTTVMLLITLMMPFAGTAFGAAAVFLLGRSMPRPLQRLLAGFAAGVMSAAAVWSLLLPAIWMSQSGDLPVWLPAAAGFAGGVLFLLLLDNTIPHLHIGASRSEGPAAMAAGLSPTAKLAFAVTLHNIPEGMAVGAVLAAAFSTGTAITMTAALALSFGIAVQNIPEGAIVSLPLRRDGRGRVKAFVCGVLSGAVEPAAATVTLLLVDLLLPWLPWLLAFAAGAMFYVVVEELIPDAQREPHSDIGTIGFALGFLLMMVLDTAFGQNN